MLRECPGPAWSLPAEGTVQVLPGSPHGPAVHVTDRAWRGSTGQHSQAAKRSAGERASCVAGFTEACSHVLRLLHRPKVFMG